MQHGINDHTTGSTVVFVVVVDKDRLTNKSLVSLFNFLGRKLVEVVVTAA